MNRPAEKQSLAIDQDSLQHKLAITSVRLTELVGCITQQIPDSQMPGNLRESIRLSKAWLERMKE